MAQDNRRRNPETRAGIKADRTRVFDPTDPTWPFSPSAPPKSGNGIYRTFVPQITKDTKVDMAGADGMSILVSVEDPYEVYEGTRNPPGFTPPWAYRTLGTASAVELGVLLVNASSNLNKLSRTDMVEATDENLGTKKVLLKFTSGTINNNLNTFGDYRMSDDPTWGGWTNPFHYVNYPEFVNEKTGGLPNELGDFPYNYNGDWGAAFFSRRVLGLSKTTPAKKLKGPPGNDVPSKHKAFQDYKEAKTFETTGLGGMEQYDFVHNLDRTFHEEYAESLSSTVRPSDVHLASFIELKKNLEIFGHEDPVLWGFDIIIDWDSSPLFNGAIPAFLERISRLNADGNPTANLELYSRLDLYQRFLDQFTKYFKINRSAGENPPLVKSYYLKALSGLDALVEGAVTNVSDTVRSMVNYGSDAIKLTLQEDVTINTGYLGVLYKTLSWSRLNGKQMIPENLLRFDCRIVVSEIRNYKRLVKRESDPNDPNSAVGWEEYVDNVNKYIYKLYDCQFQFEKLSHGDEIDMSQRPEAKDSYSISFNYKYSNLKFERFNPKKYLVTAESDYNIDVQVVDNSRVDPTDWYSRRAIAGPDSPAVVFSVTPEGNAEVDPGAEDLVPRNLTPTDVYRKNPKDTPEEGSAGDPTRTEAQEYWSDGPFSDDRGILARRQELQRIKRRDELRAKGDKWKEYTGKQETTLDRAKRKEFNRQLRQQLGKRIKQAAAREVNRRITDQARLLNRTLDNIRDALLVGRMSPPTNVYQADYLRGVIPDIRFSFAGQNVRIGLEPSAMAQADLGNALRGFVGQSVRGFFTRPRG